MAGALIGALRVSLSAETSAFEAGMKKSQRVAKQTANSIVSDFKTAGGAMGALKSGVAGFVASLSVGTVIAAGKAALDYAASLGETAEQLGVTTRELQNFRAAAGQNGASLEQADAALGKFSLSISKALSGSKQMTAAFGAVGVTLGDLQSGSKWEVLGKIADGMKATGGASANAAAGVAIFGKGFQKIIPTLDQGSAGINQLAEANERLGGVLSDSQIQNADKTADKIEQLSNVLKARIAADVAENTNAIAQFANFLFDLAKAATEARAALEWFERNYNIGNLAKGNAFGLNTPGKSVTTKLGQGGFADAEARKRGLKLMSDVPRSGGGAPRQFLAGGGGGGRKGARDRSAEEALRKQIDALRDANQFDQDIRRANIDILNAKRDLATDAVERYQISIDTKDAEDAAFQAQLAYEVKLNELSKGQDGITAAQAQELQLKHDQLSQLERDKLKADENHRAFEESARLDDLQFSLQKDVLQSELQNADTAKEQRDLQLKLLDLSYRQERARLETIIADEQSSDAAKEEARRRLANLNRTYGNDQQAVRNNTRGPLEDYRNQLPLDADKMNEALENVAVNGLKSLEDGLMDVIEGTKSVKEAFHDMAAAILADLLRIAIQKYVIGTIMNLAGGGTGASAGGGGGFASGGYTGNGAVNAIAGVVHGKEYVINAKATQKYLPLLEAINSGKIPGMAMGGLAGGLPIARTPYSARAVAANDTGGIPPVTINADFRGVDSSSVAKVQADLNRLKAELPGHIVSTVKDASDRFILRGLR